MTARARTAAEPPHHRHHQDGESPSGRRAAPAHAGTLRRHDDRSACRALLALGFAGALRRSELCALLVEDLTEVPDGLRLTLRKSKTDQLGQGQEIAIPRGYKLRPVETVHAWLAAAEINSGPVFRSINRGGRVGTRPLSNRDVARIVKRYARAVGLDAASYSGHSLRAGYVTSCVEANAPIMKIAEQTRHRSVDMIRVYSRRADLFRDHSGAAFL